MSVFGAYAICLMPNVIFSYGKRIFFMNPVDLEMLREKFGEKIKNIKEQSKFFFILNFRSQTKISHGI